MVHAHLFSFGGVVCLLAGRLGNEENVGPNFENIRVVQKNGSGRIKGDVGCDRMVFAINSDLFVMKFNSFFNKWSLNLDQKTINP